MAILKVFSIRSKTYRDALDYVRYRHDEEERFPVTDEEGNRILREEYILSGIRCVPDAFPLECRQLDALYGKNVEPDEIKMYEIIISYHPLDGQMYLLDGEKAQDLTMELMERCLPGTMGIACTHLDGDHHQGNIHTHVFLSSVKLTDEYCHTMHFPMDQEAGSKLNFSPYIIHELKLELQKIVIREELHRDNLFSLPDVRISNGEYYVQQNGQKKLDRLNAERIAMGLEPEETVFRTEKQQIRDAAEDAAMRSFSEDDFKDILLWEHRILVTVDNDRWRYGFMKHERSYLETTLGGNYLQRTVLGIIQENRRDPERVSEYKKEQAARSVDAPVVKGPDLADRSDCIRIISASSQDSPLKLAIWEEVSSGRLNRGEDSCPMEILTPLAETVQFLDKYEIRTLEELDGKLKSVLLNEDYNRTRLPQWKETLRINRNKVRCAKVLERDISRLPMSGTEASETGHHDVGKYLREVEHAKEYLARMEPRMPISSEKLWEEKMFAQRMVDSLKRMTKETDRELESTRSAIAVLSPMRESLEASEWFYAVLMPSIEERLPSDHWQEHFDFMGKRFGLYTLQYEELLRQKEPEPAHEEPERQRTRNISYDMEL